ncbi:TA system antitoxin ParD family protein [Celeribacter sp.]|uniref:TA system antitoxin ParD family protein n=1 Tax=Celeribacter sp. TaxID=1890673 RepID=UPI003A91A965
MARSVKLSDDIMEIVNREADLHSRSLAGQITHWIKIGRAIERSRNFDHNRITAALDGRLDPSELTEEEDAVWTEVFIEKMGEPSDEEKTLFAERRRLGIGVGLDASGNLIYAKPSVAE